MRVNVYFFKSLHRVLLSAFLLCIVVTACGPSKKTGTVTGIALAEGQTVAVVKLDDGNEVKAIPMSEMTRITGGQRVEVEPTKDSELWKVTRILETSK